jgi:hypothetical protein
MSGTELLTLRHRTPRGRPGHRLPSPKRRRAWLAPVAPPCSAASRSRRAAPVLRRLPHAPTWLRSFKWSNVRECDAVTRELLTRLWAAGSGPVDPAALAAWNKGDEETYMKLYDPSVRTTVWGRSRSTRHSDQQTEVGSPGLDSTGPGRPADRERRLEELAGGSWLVVHPVRAAECGGAAAEAGAAQRRGEDLKLDLVRGRAAWPRRWSRSASGRPGFRRVFR